MFWTIVLAVLVFSVMVIMHEFGHFICARIFGVGVNEFAVGMGPKLFSIKGKKTEYSLRLFPIGGFCSMVGEEESDDSPEALCNKPVWNRLIIMAAGAIMNLLFGFIVMCVIVASSGALGGRTVAEFNDGSTSNSEGGLIENDEILKIGNHNIYTLTDIKYYVLHDGVEPVDVTVMREGERIVLQDIIFATGTEENITVGVMDFKVYAVEKTLGSVLYYSLFDSISNVRMIWGSLFDLLTGRFGMDAMSGPVGVTTAIGNAAKDGMIQLLSIVSFISMNLGIFNLLPLPALDGGHIIFLLIELVRGKPVKPEHEAYVHLAGMALLIILMLYVTFNDIIKLIRQV